MEGKKTHRFSSAGSIVNVFVLVEVVDSAARIPTGESQVRTTAVNDLIFGERKDARRQIVHGPQPSVGWYARHH